MERRKFIGLCAATALLPRLGRSAEGMEGGIRDFGRSRLVAEDGAPLKAANVARNEAMVFAYPYAGIPCFLIDLGKPAAAATARRSSDDGDYENPAGVGPRRSLVAFIAICTHQLSYPSPNASFLRYAADGSELAGAPGRIVCCAHGSVFDPANGASRVAGPAPSPLLPVRLEYDAESDELSATGTVGEAFFERFFKAFKSELIERFGPGGYRREVGATTAATPLSRYSKLISTC